VGTGFRPPSLFEVAYNRGPFAFPPASGVTLVEESSLGYDLGLEYEGAAGVHLEITYFDQEIEDEIFFDLTGFSGYLQSLGTSTSKGVEIGARAPLGERWEIVGNWTNNDTGDTANEQRLRRPKNLGNIGIEYASADAKLRFAANYRLSKDSIDIGGVALDDYEVLDLSTSYAFNANFELYARVENATDEDYQDLIGYNTPGRTAYAGMRLRF
jgi:vitamin B12 transporter